MIMYNPVLNAVFCIFSGRTTPQRSGGQEKGMDMKREQMLFFSKKHFIKDNNTCLF